MFRIGNQVKCIDSTPHTELGDGRSITNYISKIIKGNSYTVTGVDYDKGFLKILGSKIWWSTDRFEKVFFWGEKVVCIHSDTDERLKEHKVYIVEDYCGGMVKVYYVDGYWFENRFVQGSDYGAFKDSQYIKTKVIVRKLCV